MLVENQPFSFVVTYVEADNEFLKIWAQTDEKVVQSVNILLSELQMKLNCCCPPNNIVPNVHCCARRHNSSEFYRAKILGTRSDGMIRLHFIDYGDVTHVPRNSVRLLDGTLEANYLFSIPDAAQPFILADVKPVGGYWMENIVTMIYSILVNNRYVGVFQTINNCRFIKFRAFNDDFSKVLINKNMAIYNAFTYQVTPAPVPVQPMRAYQIGNVAQDNWRAPINHQNTSASVAAVKAIQLEINSTHDVTVSYVEEGPCKFSVQLLESIPHLTAMMEKINSQNHLPLQEPPIAGAVCLGIQSKTKKLCRVVLNSPGDTTCKVYFADYGHHEVLPFTSIYQIPNEFVLPNVFSIRFTLSGIMNWNITEEMKDYFGGLVDEQILKLRVCKGPMSPLTQYCDLYLRDGRNVKDVLFENFLSQCMPSYDVPKQLQKGLTKNVWVSYIISPAKFFVQLNDDITLLDNILEEIDKIAKTAENLVASQIYRGMPCIALYDVDKKWYRASITDVIDNKIKVFYVDFGNEEIVTINSLRAIPAKFIKMLPKQAIPCSLHGIPLESINKELTQNFKALVGEELLSLTVQDILPNNSILVHLHDRNNIPGASGKNITERLNDFKAAIKQSTAFNRSAENNQDTTFTPLQFRTENENRSNNWEKIRVHDSSNELKNRKDNENEQRYDNRYRKGIGNDNAMGLEKPERFGQSSDRFGKSSDFQNISSQSSRDFGTNDRFNRGPPTRDNTYDVNNIHSGRVNKENQGNKSNYSVHLERNVAFDKAGSDKDSDTSSRSSGRRNDRTPKRNVDDKHRRSIPNIQPNNRQQIGRWDNEEHQNLSNVGNVSITEVKSPSHEKLLSKKSSANGSEITRYFTSTPISKIPPPNITVGAVKNCELVFYTSPSNFYVHLLPDNEELYAISSRIQAIYGSENCDRTLQASKIKENLQCVAQYAKDNQWYRAIVQSVESSVATVHFVDYGNVEKVSFDKIKEIDAEFIELPVQAVHCKLFGLSKVNWSKEEIDILIDKLFEKTLEAEFINEENGIYEILVRDANCNNQKYINDLFTNEAIDWKQEKEALLAVTRIPRNDEKLIFTNFNALNEKWLENKINLGVKYDVLLAWFINPENFYCQLASQQHDFRTMMNEIQTFYEKIPPVSQPLEVGSSVIAVLPDDGVLYRAEVLELNKPRGHVVQYIDYGDKAMVDPQKIYPVDQKFRILPKQAIFCGLKNIAPPSGSNWTTSPERNKIFDTEKFECIFHESRENKYFVSLAANNSDIASALVDKNVAVFLSKTSTEIVNEDATENHDLPKIDISLLEGQTLLVKVSSVECVSKFYVQFYTAETCQSIVDTFMNTNNPEVMPHLLSHEICIGAGSLVSCNGKWRRSVVMNCNKPNYEVRLIDTGEHKTFTLNNMLGLPGQLAIMQYQATECALFDITRSLKADDLLKKTITGKDVKIFVEKVECNRLIVRLFDLNGNKIKISDSQNTEKINPVCSMQILNSTHDVIVSCINNAKSVWLQRKADDLVEKRLLDALYEHYSKVNSERDASMKIEENELYAVLSYDNNWYRAKVIKLKETEKKARVVLIDYGNEEDVPFKNFCKLESQFYVPHQLAIEVSLTVKIGGSNEEQQKILDEFFGMKVFSATFYNFNRKWVAELSDGGEKISDQLASLNVVEQGPKVPHLGELQKQLPDMKVGERYKISVSFVDNPSQLWLQRDEEVAALNELRAQLQIVAAAITTEGTANSLSSIVWEEKMLCLALYTYDNHWYRAEVIDTDLKIVTVRFIDYGNSDVVDNNPKQVLPLPEKWKAVRRFATQCKLDVLPANTSNDWSEEACKKLSDLLVDVRETLIIADKSPMRVDLFLSDERSVCKILIEEKLAEPASSSDSLSNTATARLDEQEDTDEDEEMQLDPRSAFVSCHVSVDFFWMQEEKWVSELEMIEDRLLMATVCPQITEVKVGMMCVAKFTDNRYYRATVLSHDENGTRVFYLDYGNTGISEDLRVITEDLVKIRPLVRNCRLAKPEGVKHWPANINKEFEKLANQGQTVFLLDILEEGETCLVKLTLNSKDVALELIEKCTKADQSGQPIDDKSPTPLLTVEASTEREERPSPIGQENPLELVQKKQIVEVINTKLDNSKHKNMADYNGDTQFETEQHEVNADNLSSTSQNSEDSKEKNTSNDSACISETDQLKINYFDKNSTEIIHTDDDIMKIKKEIALNIAENKISTESHDSITDKKKKNELVDDIKLTKENEFC